MEVEKVKFGFDLNTEEREQLNNLLRKYDTVFFKEGADFSFTHEIKHEIVTNVEKPIYSKNYRYPFVHIVEVERQIKEMLDQGIIRPSNSPYSAPIWIVPKGSEKEGHKKWRVVIDYRRLNEVTVEDKFPIPNIDDILDKLGRAMYFSKLDLTKGFHQIEMTERISIRQHLVLTEGIMNS